MLDHERAVFVSYGRGKESLIRETIVHRQDQALQKHDSEGRAIEAI